MNRVVIPELLDTDSGAPGEVSTALSDLRHINQWFGGIATSQSMVAMACRFGKSRQIIVAVGSRRRRGFVPHAVSKRMLGLGVDVHVTLLDRAASHLRNGLGNGTRAIAGDATALPFADGSFDVVSCCLFVHHLEPDDIVRFVNEGLRVCRKAVVINDVVRDPVHLALVYLSLPLYRSRFTHHDAPASVKRAYTIAEMREMLGKTSAARVEIARHPLYRMGAIAWKD